MCKISITNDIVVAVSSLSKTSRPARQLLDNFSARSRDISCTKISHLGALTASSHQEALKLARSLDEIGVCQYVKGARGWPSRVLWKVNIRNLAQAIAS